MESAERTSLKERNGWRAYRYSAEERCRKGNRRKSKEKLIKAVLK